MGFDWDLGNVTLSVTEEGFLSVQVDAFGEEKSGTPPFELQHPFGFTSRPLDPDEKGACQMLYAWEGDAAYAWLGSDPRMASKLPALKKGGSCQYCGKGGFASFDGDTTDWTLYVPTDFSGDAATKAHIFSVGKDKNGKRAIAIVHGDGMGLSMLEGGKNSAVLKNKDGSAFYEANDDGLNLSAKLTAIIGMLGITSPPPVGPIPAPLPLAAVKDGAVVLCPDAVLPAEHVAMAETLLTYLDALVVMVNAIRAVPVIAAAVPAPMPPPPTTIAAKKTKAT